MSGQDRKQIGLTAVISGYDLWLFLSRQNTKIKSALKDRLALAWRWSAFSFRVKVPVWENNYRQRSVE